MHFGPRRVTARRASAQCRRAVQDGRMPRPATAQDFAAWFELKCDTRAHLWLTCALLVDELRMELDATDGDQPPWEVQLAPFGFAECLPAAQRGKYDATTALAFTHALDAVIWKLGNQPGAQDPRPRSAILSEGPATFRSGPRSRAHRASPRPGRPLVGSCPLRGVQVPPTSPDRPTRQRPKRTL